VQIGLHSWAGSVSPESGVRDSLNKSDDISFPRQSPRLHRFVMPFSIGRTVRHCGWWTGCRQGGHVVTSPCGSRIYTIEYRDFSLRVRPTTRCALCTYAGWSTERLGLIFTLRPLFWWRLNRTSPDEYSWRFVITHGEAWECTRHCTLLDDTQWMLGRPQQHESCSYSSRDWRRFKRSWFTYTGVTVRGLTNGDRKHSSTWRYRELTPSRRD